MRSSIASTSCSGSPPAPTAWLLPLALPAAERAPHRRHARVRRLARFAPVPGRRAAALPLGGRGGDAAGGECEREVHPPEERAAVRPRLLPLRAAGGRRLEAGRLPRPPGA